MYTCAMALFHHRTTVKMCSVLPRCHLCCGAFTSLLTPLIFYICTYFVTFVHATNCHIHGTHSFTAPVYSLQSQIATFIALIGLFYAKSLMALVNIIVLLSLSEVLFTSTAFGNPGDIEDMFERPIETSFACAKGKYGVASILASFDAVAHSFCMSQCSMSRFCSAYTYHMSQSSNYESSMCLLHDLGLSAYAVELLSDDGGAKFCQKDPILRGCLVPPFAPTVTPRVVGHFLNPTYSHVQRGSRIERIQCLPPQTGRIGTGFMTCESDMFWDLPISVDKFCRAGARLTVDCSHMSYHGVNGDIDKVIYTQRCMSNGTWGPNNIVGPCKPFICKHIAITDSLSTVTFPQIFVNITNDPYNANGSYHLSGQQVSRACVTYFALSGVHTRRNVLSTCSSGGIWSPIYNENCLRVEKLFVAPRHGGYYLDMWPRTTGPNPSAVARWFCVRQPSGYKRGISWQSKTTGLKNRIFDGTICPCCACGCIWNILCAKY